MATAAQVHTHRTDEKGFYVNSYLVETANGVVAVDAPFLLSDARTFRAQFERLGKPLLAVLITHAHPDHVNGIATLTAGHAAPIIATYAVDRVFRETAEPKRAQWTPIYGDDYPQTFVWPTRLVSDGDAVTFDGVTYRVRDGGAGESASEAIWIADDAGIAFIGDLAYSHVHPYLLEGQTAAWLRQIEHERASLPDTLTLYPGHGEPGGHDLLNWQRAYVERYRATVDELRGDAGSLDAAAQNELDARMAAFVPDAPLRMLVKMGADPVAGELAGEHPTAA